MAKKTDFKNKDRKELIKTLTEKKGSLREFRFNISGSKIKNLKEGRNLRKDIARILTVLHESAKTQ